MSLSCHVIEDLLPLYLDHVCSEESCHVIEEHLQQCPRCAELFAAMQTEPISTQAAIEDAAPIKAVSAAWNRSKLKSLAKGAAIAVLACAVLFGSYLGLTRWKCISVSPQLMEVSEVSRLADGRIIYHLNVKDDKDLHFVKFTTNSDGSYYMTPMRAVLEGRRNTDTGLFNDYFMVDIAEDNAYQRKHGDGVDITSCYLGPVGDGILLWEDGMELPAASQALEQVAG